MHKIPNANTESRHQHRALSQWFATLRERTSACRFSRFIIKESEKMFKEFKTFIARGNVMDLAIAVIIGAAFGKIITSLVEGVLIPPLGLALGKVDFSSLFYVLDSTKGVPASLAEAKTKGVP